MDGLEAVRAEYDRLDRMLGIDTSGILLSCSARMVRQMVCKKSQISGPSFSSTYSRSEIYRQRQYCAISAKEFSG